MQIEQLQMQCCQLEKEAARREGDSEVARREAENKLAERTRVALREQQLEYEGQVSRLSLYWLCLATLAVPTLAVPALAVPALAVPALAVPTLAVPTLAVPTAHIHIHPCCSTLSTVGEWRGYYVMLGK